VERGTAETAPEEVQHERARPHRRFEPRPEHEERVHVQHQVQDPVVHEHVREPAPQGALEAAILEAEHGKRVRVADDRPLKEQHRRADGDQRPHTTRQPRGVVLIELDWDGHRTVLRCS
jgi:hypothetical protein